MLWQASVDGTVPHPRSTFNVKCLEISGSVSFFFLSFIVMLKIGPKVKQISMGRGSQAAGVVEYVGADSVFRKGPVGLEVELEEVP